MAKRNIWDLMYERKREQMEKQDIGYDELSEAKLEQALMESGEDTREDFLNGS